MENKHIEKVDLKQTVFILYDMEINNYLMTRLIRKSNDKITSLGIEKNYTPPTKKKIKISFWEIFKVICLPVLSVGAILGAIIGVYQAIFGYNSFLAFLFWFLIGPIYAALGTVISLVAVIVIAATISIISKSIKSKKNDAIYQKEYAAYQEKVLSDKQRVDAELIQKQALTKKIGELSEKLSISKELLFELYEKLNVNEALRNIVSIGYLYEYAKREAANDLKELCDIVCNDIKSSVANASFESFDAPAEQKGEIHIELRKANDKCDMIINSTNEVEKISKYISERFEKEAEYQSFVMLFKNQTD